MSTNNYMNNKNREDFRTAICPVCGKEFVVPVFNIYKLEVKGRLYNYCKYICFRKAQKEKEQSKIRKYAVYNR